MSDLVFLTATLMAERIRKKKLSPVEIVDAHLEQIERMNPKLNAFVQVDAERARQAAHDAEVAVMHEKTLGSLHGIPISIKSSLAVAGMLCESGPRARSFWV
jgi:aspartyl-tRNA(Asn)/glutamyl-tRNA(Gln) amidotransferase subunit A